MKTKKIISLMISIGIMISVIIIVIARIRGIKVPGTAWMALSLCNVINVFLTISITNKE